MLLGAELSRTLLQLRLVFRANATCIDGDRDHGLTVGFFQVRSTERSVEAAAIREYDGHQDWGGFRGPWIGKRDSIKQRKRQLSRESAHFNSATARINSARLSATRVCTPHHRSNADAPPDSQ